MSESSSNSSKRSGNTKQISPSKHWCFTLNNYTEEEIKMIKEIDSSIVPILGFQEEIGEETGTPHLQGYLAFDRKRRPFEVFKTHRIRWSKCRKIKNSINYIQKQDTKKEDGIRYLRGIEEIFSGPELDLKPWMQEIVDIIDQRPDPRKIYWYWEQRGNSGKTIFAQWLFHNKERVIAVSGKASDMKHGIVAYQEKNNSLPRVIIVNVPRNNKNFISYTGLEEIKDMFFFSGKYESGMVSGPRPHLIVFSNSPPDYDEMSEDRWAIRHIDNT